MKNTLSLWILLILVLTAIPVYAQSTLALQEKCAEGAEKFFFERINSYGGKWGSFSDEKRFGRNDFTSHYNKRLDKCFIRIDYHEMPKDKNESAIHGADVWNVFEGTLLGSFAYGGLDSSVSPCNVGNKTCNSVREFEALIKPYMEE
jgi:hypothetical protein